MNWDFEGYFEAAEPKPLHPIFGRADAHLHGPGLAVDLGCGTGKSCLHLLDRGYRVLAVEPHPTARAKLIARLPPGAPVEVVADRFQEMTIPPCEAVVAVLSLFFMARSESDAFWPEIVAALLPGGLFIGQILGVRDSWVADGCAAYTAEEARALFDAFEVLDWEEAERNSVTVQGEPKHWHVFHVVARRRV
ncbi:MAG: class I SAM-dependent methyltransferase [Fimbriimonadaceae bacterium]|nr:class I SAM-dependent methyltransferase [Fimbriimonadaceae bacterium]